MREVLRDGIDEGTKPTNWEKLREPARVLAGDVTKAVIDAGGSYPIATTINESVDRFVRTFLHAASEELDADVTPAVARSVRASVDAVLAAMLSDTTKLRFEDITSGVTAAALTAMSRGMSRGLREQLAPALADALDKSLGPAIQRLIQNLGPTVAATLQHDLAPALVDSTRCASTAAAEGFFDGVRGRAEPLLDQGWARVQVALNGAERSSYAILQVVLVVVFALATGVLGVCLWLRSRAARASSEALHLVASEIGRMSTEPKILELGKRIKLAGEGSEGGAFLAAHLREHPSIKLKPPAVG